MDDTLHIVASYDISDSKRLARVARAMKDYGERVLKKECLRVFSSATSKGKGLWT